MWELYDYVNERGINEVAEWTRKLQKPERIKLRSKLDMLAKAGGDLPPQLLMKTEVPYIYKLKVQGNPKLRPMLCQSLLLVKNEETGKEEEKDSFLLLIGAKEISWDFEPRGADIEASMRRIEAINNPERRVKHERID